MCGIAGVLSSGRSPKAIAARMLGPISHRGPDDSGLWIDYSAGVGLGHRRLSIVDLSPSGHQPMRSANGRFVLCFNGEIYNHRDIRAELERGAASAIRWRGHSDTEVLLEAISAWGLDRAVRKSIGMFAFALWDGRDRALHLVRDRFGEKPLYYGWAGTDFVFASELKALRAHPRFDNPLDRRALRLFASRGFIPAPLSIYERVFKLLPGCILTVPIAAASKPLIDSPLEGTADGLKLLRYWSYRDVVHAGLAQPFDDEAEALAQVEGALGEAIRRQSLADVPVGAFLSGGIDSSTVVALYQNHSPVAVRTYSVGFEESGFNEADDAKRVANHLGTVHHEHYVTAKDASDIIPLLPGIYDEPFADSSQIPTYLISRFAKRDVTVALTGDGGDELFGGYRRHFIAPRMWQLLRGIPRPIRMVAGTALGQFPPKLWSAAALLLRKPQQLHLGAKIKKAMHVAASARSIHDVYRLSVDEWSFRESPVCADVDTEIWGCHQGSVNAPDATQMMYFDAVTYLPDDILCKVDRAAMAVSLETRVPFLDHRVAEAAARVPMEMKLRNGRGKRLLRKILRRYVPDELVDRPKSGFAIPVGEWVKGPLRPWAEELLEDRRLAIQGWFQPKMVRARWEDHLSGRHDSASALWAVLMFQAWLERQREDVAAAA